MKKPLLKIIEGYGTFAALSIMRENQNKLLDYIDYLENKLDKPQKKG